MFSSSPYHRTQTAHIPQAYSSPYYVQSVARVVFRKAAGQFAQVSFESVPQIDLPACVGARCTLTR